MEVLVNTEVAPVVESGGDSVVEDHAVLAEHEAVAAAAGTEALPGVGVDAVEELAGVGAGDFDLAEGGVVEDADAVADGEAFAGDGFVHGFAGLGVVPGAAPLADVFESGRRRTSCHSCMGVTRTGSASGTDVASGDGAEGDRGVGGTVTGRAHGGGIATEQLGDDTGGEGIGELALVGSHAEGGVALDVFDGFEALAEGEAEVVEGDVFVEVDELGLGAGEVARGEPVRLDGSLRGLGGPEDFGVAAVGVAGSRGSGGTGLRALAEGGGQLQFTRHSAGGMDAAARFGGKGSERWVPLCWATGLGVEVEGGGEAAGDSEEVAFDGAEGGAVQRAELGGGDAATAVGMADNRARLDGDALPASLGREIAVNFVSNIGNGGDGDSGIGQVERGAVGGSRCW